MTGTGLLQVGYFLFLQPGYGLGDLSLVYPMGRGSGALLSALAGIVLLGERPGPAGIAGIVLVVLGVLVLGAPGRGRAGAPPPAPPGASRVPVPRGRPGVVFALVAGAFIAAYTLWDKYAVSTLNGRRCCRVTPRCRRWSWCWPPPRCASGAGSCWCGGATGSRYRGRGAVPAGLHPGADRPGLQRGRAVAPAREVSVLAGVILGRRLLGEGSLARRLAAAAAIAAGIICIAVGCHGAVA